jgi:hypothetical protein
MAPRVTAAEGGVKHLAVYRLTDRVMVACHTPTASAETALREVIGKVVQANAQGVHPRLTVTDAAHGAIHYETGRAAVYVAVSTIDYPQRVAFRAIGELRARFDSGFEDALHKAEEGGLSKAAQPLMSELCTRFADAAAAEKAISVRRQVDEVSGIVGESIQALLATHESLEVLEDRSEALRQQTSTFHKTARTTRVVAQRKQRRLGGLSCIVLLVLLAAAAAPVIVRYWDDILRFLDTMLPPCDSRWNRDDSCDVGSGAEASGEDASGAAYEGSDVANATANAMNATGNATAR